MIGRFEAFGWGGRHGTGAMELGDFFRFPILKKLQFFFCLFYFFIKKIYFVFFNSGFYRKLSCFLRISEYCLVF